MNWITDWKEIDDGKTYLTQPVNRRPDGTIYLGAPPQIDPGWRVRRLREQCYAALELPPFDPGQVPWNTRKEEK